MDGSPFITLAAGGMQPEPSLNPSSTQSESSSQRDSSPASSISVATHDTSRTKYHIDELGTFVARLENAAASIFPNKGRSRYKDVHVLLLRWEEDTMGVQYELDDLAKTFKATYGFETETWLIPTLKSHFALMGKALQIVEDFGKADNFLIVYYAGHGLMNGSRQALWTCKGDPNYASLQWYAIQTLFEQAESDVLLLLDCCAAASRAPADGDSPSVTETIAACGFETWAPQPGRHSFTNTLIAVLDEWQDRPAFTAAMLHCEILNRLRHEKPEKYRGTKKFEFRKSPIHIVSTRDPKARSVELSPRTKAISCPESESALSNDLPNTRGAMISKSLMNNASPSNVTNTAGRGDDAYNVSSLAKVLDSGETMLPHVLISLALEEEQLLDYEQCRRWLQEFPALAKHAKVQGVYKSNSTLLLLSVPVAIWDWIPDDPACSFIGYVHTQNLLHPHSEWDDESVDWNSLMPSRRSSIAKPDNERMSLPKSWSTSSYAPSMASSYTASKAPSSVSSIAPSNASSSSSPEIANLIQVAGSAEKVIQYLLKEKQSQAEQNLQLWRLVDKRRAMILGLNKEKDRDKKIIKEIQKLVTPRTSDIKSLYEVGDGIDFADGK